jgi:hypothetical protein
MVNTDGMSKELIAELAFSESELNEIKLAREKTITFDEDCMEVIKKWALAIAVACFFVKNYQK